MNKPNGISDKVWEDAQAATGMYFHNGSYELIVQSVALAISKAIEEEREEIIEMVDGFPTGLGNAFPGIISQAIRSRSKGQE